MGFVADLDIVIFTFIDLKLVDHIGKNSSLTRIMIIPEMSL